MLQCAGMATDKSMEHAAETLAFDAFWTWLQAHPNCIIRAGTPEAVLYDDEDLHWHFTAEGSDTLVVQVLRGKRLVIPENGFMSLNPPLLPERRGALSTRTTHPSFLAQLREVLDVVGIDVELDVPFAALTKGETFRLVPGEHTVVAYGYDAAGLDIMDVGTGGYYHSSWASFLRRWG